MVARATNLTPDTVTAGLRDLHHPNRVPTGRIRKAGSGRRRVGNQDPTLLADLNALINPATRGDPESSLRWTSKNIGKLAAELRAQGHQESADIVGHL